MTHAALRRGGGWLATCSKFAAVAGMSMQRRSRQLAELAVRSSFLAVMLFIFSQLWRVVPGPPGYSLTQLIWYMAFAEGIIFTTSSNTEPELDRELRNGDITYRIARPLAFPLHHLAASLGDRLVRWVFNLTVALLLAYALVGMLPMHGLAVTAAVSCALLAVVIDELVTLTLSMTSLWIESSYGLHLLYRRGMLLLGGALVPLSVYPEWLARICAALPFRHLIAGPATLFVGRDAHDWANLTALQLGFGATVVLVAYTLYRLGLRRMVAQGG
ncbi:MAG TPA: hypothetical protein VJV78_20385 [Polyangiales bacterium]|nr:hypothetical protein [Polyangiales bacterium]